MRRAPLYATSRRAVQGSPINAIKSTLLSRFMSVLVLVISAAALMQRRQRLNERVVDRGIRDSSDLQWSNHDNTRMWASAQRDGRSAKYRWRPLFNAAKFG